MKKRTLQDYRVKDVELLDLFPATEGTIIQYYGRIGSGKTYAGTSDILELLRKGKVVYVNWKMNYQGYDESRSKFRLFVSLIFPWIKRFYSFPKDNLRYYEISDKWAQGQGYKDFDAWVASRTDCFIYADEGHVWVDSYASTRISMERRTTILHTRHFNRTLCIISQRPTAIHVTMRANVNIFYKCEKIFQWGPIVRFKRTEYQDMQQESVDEDEEKEISRKYYWGKKKVFEAYNTKYLRGDTPTSQKVFFEAYDLGFFKKVGLFFKGKDKVLSHETVKLSTGYPQPVRKLPDLPVKVKVLHLGHEYKTIESYDRNAKRKGFFSSLFRKKNK